MSSYVTPSDLFQCGWSLGAVSNVILYNTIRFILEWLVSREVSNAILYNITIRLILEWLVSREVSDGILYNITIRLILEWLVSREVSNVILYNTIRLISLPCIDIYFFHVNFIKSNLISCFYEDSIEKPPVPFLYELFHK